MFLGWFDVDVDTARVAAALQATGARDVASRLPSGEGYGLITVAGPVPNRCTARDGVHAFLEGCALREEHEGFTEIENDSQLAALASRCLSPGCEDWRALGGGFAMAVMEPSTRTLVLATDRFAQRPVYYARLGEGLVFGSNPGVVGVFPGVQLEMDLQSAFDYFYFHVIPGPRTIYQGIERMEAATTLRLRSARIETSAYWQPCFDDDPQGFTRPDAQVWVRDAMQRAVSRSVGSGRSVGAFLSGGIDSSTVAGNLSRISDGQAKVFSIGFDVDGYDETEFARTAAETFDLELLTYNVTPADIVEVLPRLASVYGQPFGNASAVPTYFCAKLAKSHGIELLLGGDGGDELFGGNARYAFQWLLGLYGRVPEVVRRRLLEPAVMGPEFIKDVPLLRKLRSYVSQARVELPARMEGSNLLGRLGVGEFFTPGFLREVDVDYPLRLQSSTFDAVAARRDLNRILGFEFKITLADNDLPKVRGMSNAAGVDVHFPFLDNELVDFALALPVSEKVRGTTLRPFFKSAMRGFLPDKILDKSKHGFGLPYGHWLRSHASLRELSFDLLRTLRQREIVRGAMIDELMGKRLDEHASYYGSAIWLLVVFELWLQSSESRPTLE